MRVNLYVFFLFLATVTPHLAQAQGAGKQAYRAAEELRKQNQCEEAIGAYELAIKLEPANFRYYFQKGRCELKLNAHEAAKQSFRRAIEFQPDYPPAYSMLAKVYRLEKDYENAIYFYKEAANFEQRPDRKLQYCVLLVNLMLQQGDLQAARNQLAEGLELAPDHPTLLFYQAEIHTMEDNWEAARQKYTLALESEAVQAMPPPDKAKYYYGLGLTQMRLGQPAEARKAWAKASFGPYKELIEKQLQEDNYVYFYKVAVSYYLQGAYEESETYVAQALAKKEDFSNAHLLEGKIAEKQRDADRAVRSYERAMALEDNPARQAKIAILVANIHLEQQNGQRALEALKPALAVAPQNPNWQYLKARAAYMAGEYREAMTTLEVLLRLGVDEKTKARYSFLMGMSAKAMDDTETAIQAFKGAFYGPYRAAAQVEIEKLGG